MSALTSLLVRDQVLSLRKIETALEKHVVEGGDLESVLLEMDAAPENVLSAYRAVLYGLLPGTRDEVMRVPKDVIARLPGDLALKHHVVPLSADGKLMVLALTEPLSLEARKEIQDQTGHEIAYRIVTQVRLLAGLAQHYGGELEPKMRRLLDRLRDKPPGLVPYVAPPPSGGRVHVPTPVVGMQAQRAVVVPVVESAASSTDAERTNPGLRLDEARGDSGSEPAASAWRRGPEGYGPLTAKRAQEVLETLDDRDAIIELYLSFAKQFLDYAVIFVVQADMASGRSAVGDGPDATAVRSLAVPLDVPGAFQAARDSRQPHIFDFNAGALDSIVAQDLSRSSAQPALLLPVVLRGRVVLYLYGDRSGRPFVLGDVPEVLAFSVRVADALGRMIALRKGRESQPGMEAPKPSSPGSISSAGDLTAANAGGPAAEPALGTPRRSERSLPYSSVRSPEPGPHGVLHVPRSAPPPPRTHVTSAPPAGAGGYQLSGTNLEEVVLRASRAPENTRQTVPPTRRASAPPEPKLPASEEADPPKESTDTPSRSSLPPKRPSLAPDARREGGGPVHSDRVTVTETRTSSPPDKRRDDDTVPDAKAYAGRRVSSRAPASGVEGAPNVIVNMGEPIEAVVDDLVRCGPDEEAAALARVLKTGEAVLPALVQRFPGPLWFDRRARHVKLPKGRDVSAIARAISAFKKVALPYVCSLLDARDPEARFYAVMLAEEFMGPEVAAKLTALLYDRDPGTRQLVTELLRGARGLDKQIDEALKAVRNQARHAKGDPGVQELAIAALGALRDRRSTKDLAALLGGADLKVRTAAHKALVDITLQDFGESQKRWEQWIEKNDDRHRIEWLVDSLLHSNEDIRGRAGEELERLTGKAFGFQVMSARREREAVQSKYREWWNREGYRLFA
jgi:hypothetical protein